VRNLVQGLDVYMASLKWEPLTTEEEVGASVSDLVKHNLRFAVLIAVRFKEICNLPLDELVSAANIGLMEAAKNFDPMVGSRFIRYAVHHIKRSIRIEISKQNQVWLPRNKWRKGERLSYTPLDAPISEDGDCFLDILPDTGPTPEEVVERVLCSERVRKGLEKLRNRDRLILNQYFGFDGPSKTLQQIGNELGLTKERVRQLRNEALGRMKGVMKRNLRQPLNN